MDRAPEVMSDRELVRALDQADADLARIETRRLRLVAALDRSGYAEQAGARDTVQYLEHRYHLDHHRARRDVHLARALPKYPAITAALPDFADLADSADLPDVGDLADDDATAPAVPAVVLRPAQAEAIVTALEKVPTTVPVADLEVAERELVRLARHLPPAELRKAAEQARDILDTDGPEPDEHKASARETLSLMTADRGVKFKGYLANENAELFRSLIFAGASPHKTIDGTPDPRTREKRQADALTTTLTMAATALDAGTPSPTIPRPTAPSTPDPSTPAPSTSGTAADTAAKAAASDPSTPGTATPGTAARDTMAADATEGSATAQTRDGAVHGADSGSVGGWAGDGVAGRGCGGVGDSGGVGGDVVPGFGAKANITVTIDLQDLKAATADAIGDTVYGPGLSAGIIRRLACDAKVIPIVLGTNSEPLDVGRSERLVTRALRRALNTRDRGCVICGAPPIMCDAHHLISWIDGGDTKISNLALLCRRHHTDLHNGHWAITITNGQVHVTRPTWADPPPHPNPRRNTAPPPWPEPGPLLPASPSSTGPPGSEPATSAPHSPAGGQAAAAARPSLADESAGGEVRPEDGRGQWSLGSALGQRTLQQLRETTGRDDFTDAELHAAVAIEAWGEQPEPPTSTIRLVPGNPTDRASDQRGSSATTTTPGRVA